MCSIISHVNGGSREMREWRNWQTRTFEGRVVHTVRVQVPFLAKEKERISVPFSFVKTDRRNVPRVAGCTRRSEK